MIATDRYQSLGELLRDALVQWKTETALVEVNRKREVARFSYLEVKRKVDPLAKRLQDLGVGADDRVAICMGNQSRWPISGAAVFLRGGVILPLDYKLTDREQEAILAHAEPKVVIAEYPAFRLWKHRVAEHVLVSEVPDSVTLPDYASRWEDALTGAGNYTFVPRARNDQATLVYSSGTSGTPKGCMLSHENYLEQIKNLGKLYPLNVGDRYFSVLPTNHAIDFLCGFLGPFAGGAMVIHQRTLRPEQIADTLERYEVTHMAVVPLILESFERRIRENLEKKSSLRQHAFEALRQVNAALTVQKPLAGLSRTLLKPIHDAFGGHLQFLFCGGAFVDRARAQFFYDIGLPVAIGYGLTEACTVLTVNDMKPFRPDSVGKPLDGVEIVLRNEDPDTGVGEVWVKSRTVMLGYYKEPALTAEAIQDGWLKTGDLGYFDAAGHLHLVGRSKNMIVTAGGKNIYPEDVEGAFESLDVEELCVVASNYVWPSGKLVDEKLVLVVRGPKSPSFLADVASLNAKLADFKRIKGVLRVTEDFPRTASMKVKRDALAEQLRRTVDPAKIENVGGT